MDGAGFVSRFCYIMLPHLARAHHRGGPDPDDLPARHLRRDPRHHQRRPRLRVHHPALPGLQAGLARVQDIGRAAAGGVIAVILANIVAIFLMRAIGKNLDA